MPQAAPDSTGCAQDSANTQPPAGISASGASPTGTLFHQRRRAKLTEPSSHPPSGLRRGITDNDSGRAPNSKPAT
jgi:hypothetical protein